MREAGHSALTRQLGGGGGSCVRRMHAGRFRCEWGDAGGARPPVTGRSVGASRMHAFLMHTLNQRAALRLELARRTCVPPTMACCFRVFHAARRLVRHELRTSAVPDASPVPAMHDGHTCAAASGGQRRHPDHAPHDGATHRHATRSAHAADPGASPLLGRPLRRAHAWPRTS